MRPSRAPRGAGLGAGSAIAADVASATTPATSCARPGRHARARSAGSNNTIFLIRFFNAILLFNIPPRSQAHTRRSPAKSSAPSGTPALWRLRLEPTPDSGGFCSSLYKFGRAALGPRVVGLRETHALIEWRMI